MNQQTMNRFPEWNLLLAELDPSRQAELYRTLAASVGDEEIEHLVSLVNSQEKSTPAALKVLTAIARSRPQLLEGRQPDIANRLQPLLQQYPKPLGLSAFYLLRLLVPRKAEDFLIGAAESEGFTDQETRILIADLSLFPSSSRVKDALEGIKKHGGQAGAEARRRLESLGCVSEEEVSALGKKWRETRTREPLNRLFEVFISKNGEKPIGPVLEILGPPSERKDRRYFYHTSDGLTLYLEQDEQGRLTAMKIK
jgi:hypothetical protein